MLQVLARHPQRIAWFFYSLFLLDMALPVVSRANERVYIPYKAFSNTPVSNRRPAATAPAGIQKAKRPVITGLSLKPAAALPALQRTETFLPKAPDSVSNGPTQPEMQSFQSVNASNMVDLFSGDFSYNIPLLDVGGYPINIHYSSGISMDQESSWVGLGWNINPGTISRNMRGLPDDFDGTDKVDKTLSMKDNKTIGVTGGGDLELFGLPLTLGASLGVFHNNYRGWGTEAAINVGINAGSAAQGPLSGG
ncbi:MAG TPA: hypothetical protein VLD19_13795, partial [Chitinophagaceae bacterium]|nr:hypothetical protein [Chitinophagaceae bacterium]